MILLPANLVFVSLETKTASPILLPTDCTPTCGCWVEQPGEPPTFFFGSRTGDVLGLKPSLSLKCFSIFRVRSAASPRTVYGLGFWRGATFVAVFIVATQQIFCFSGTGSFEALLGGGRETTIMVDPNLPMRSHLSFSSDRVKCLMATVIKQGVLTLTGRDHGRRSVVFQQSLCDINILSVQAILCTDFGVLLARPQSVTFYYEQSFSVEIQIENVVSVAICNGDLCFIKQNAVHSIPLAQFKQLLFEKAIEEKAFKYATMLANDPASRKRALLALMQTMDTKEIAEYLHALTWDLSTLLEVEGVDSPIVLFYLREILDKLPPDGVCRKVALCRWILQLHSTLLPKFRETFLDFLETFGQFLDRPTVYAGLRAVGFTDGVLRFATLLNDPDNLVRLFVETDSLDSIYQYLGQIKSHQQFVETANRLLGDKFREKTKRCLIECRRPIHKLIPILVKVPECVSVMLSDCFIFRESLATKTLFVLSLAMHHDDDQLIQLLFSGAVSSGLLIRCCRRSDCAKARAQVYIGLRQPERAVEIALDSLPLAAVHDLLNGIADAGLRKRGFVKLLQLATAQDRKATLRLIGKTDLLSFSEIVDFVDDDYFVAAVKEQFADFVRTLEEKRTMATYREVFGRKREIDFMLKLDTGCDVCNTVLMGTEFIKFGCGHVVHKSCADGAITAAAEQLMGFIRRDVKDSCPICGFLAVAYAFEAFDDAVFRVK
jgi:hypothetical protein